MFSQIQDFLKEVGPFFSYATLVSYVVFVGTVSLESDFVFNKVPESKLLNQSKTKITRTHVFLQLTDCPRNDWKWLERARNGWKCSERAV